MPECWKVHPSARPAWREWAGEYVVHHALSNDTHRLAELPGLVLANMVDRPEPRSLAALASACEADADEVMQALLALQALDFVQAC